MTGRDAVSFAGCIPAFASLFERLKARSAGWLRHLASKGCPPEPLPRNPSVRTKRRLPVSQHECIVTLPLPPLNINHIHCHLISLFPFLLSIPNPSEYFLSKNIGNRSLNPSASGSDDNSSLFTQ